MQPARPQEALRRRVQAQLPSPATLLVTGCSAGAYASLLWAANLAPFYVPRGTQLVQFGDAGMGIVTPEFLRDAYPAWNTAANFPWVIVPPALQSDRSNAAFARSNLGMPEFYTYAAKAYPTARWSQYSAAYDENQAFFYEAMFDGDTGRGEPNTAAKLRWNAQMTAAYNGSELLPLPNYAHCAFRAAGFATLTPLLPPHPAVPSQPTLLLPRDPLSPRYG